VAAVVALAVVLAVVLALGHNAPEPFIAFEQPVELIQFAQVFRRKWPPFALPNKTSEPFTQVSRLRRDVVELASLRLCPQSFKRFGGHELRLLKPGQQALAVIYPVDFGVHRGSYRIEEVQSERIGNEYGGRALRSRLRDLSAGSGRSMRCLCHLRALLMLPR
jgi:hypothetical protein